MLDRLIDKIRNLIPMPTVDPNVPVLDQAALDTALSNDEGVILVFYADWCGFCRAFLPTVEDAAGDLGTPIAAVDVSEYSNPLWDRFDVETVPTLVAYRDGEQVARIDGQAGRGLERDHLERIDQQIPA